MRAQVWKDVEADHRAEIERLHVRLAAVNESISGLEKIYPESETLAFLRDSALTLTRQIDALHCSIADRQLTGLLAR